MFFLTLTCGVFVISVVSAPPFSSSSSSSRLPHQPTALIVSNQLSSTNCCPPLVINHLSSTNCYPPLVINQLPPTICHTTSCPQPIVVNQMSPTNFHQPIATNEFHQPIVSNQMSPTNFHQPIVINHQPIVINELSPTNYDLLANCLLQGVGGAGWLLALRRCSAVICARGVQKHCVLQGFVGVEGLQFGQWRNAKTVGFTRVVSVMRAARTCVIGSFLVMGQRQRKWRNMYPNSGPQDRSKMG